MIGDVGDMHNKRALDTTSHMTPWDHEARERIPRPLRAPGDFKDKDPEMTKPIGFNSEACQACRLPMLKTENSLTDVKSIG